MLPWKRKEKNLWKKIAFNALRLYTYLVLCIHKNIIQHMPALLESKQDGEICKTARSHLQRGLQQVFLFGFVAAIKLWSKLTWWRKGFIFPDRFQSIIKGSKAGTKRQKHETETSRGKLLPDLLAMVDKASFCTQPRFTCLGITLPTVGYIILCQSVIKKMPHRHDHRPMWWGQFFT